MFIGVSFNKRNIGNNVSVQNKAFAPRMTGHVGHEAFTKVIQKRVTKATSFCIEHFQTMQLNENDKLPESILKVWYFKQRQCVGLKIVTPQTNNSKR